MSALDGATKSVMQGVSQQVPRERLDGQVSLQVNMLSDPVEGMRRRQGMRHLADGLMAGAGWGINQVFATSVDMAESAYHVLVNTFTGAVFVYDEDMTQVYTATNAYLQAPAASNIQVAALRGYLYLCNTSKVPAKIAGNGSKQDPTKTGYAYIKTGQYSKVYTLTLVINGTSYAVSYTTPDGTHPGDAAQSTPENIMNTLSNSIIALAIPNLGLQLMGAYLFMFHTNPGVITVTSDSGTNFVGVSNQSHVSTSNDLPSKLHPSANGTLISVGSNPKLSPWYRYDSAQNVWVEDSAWNSAAGLSNMPMRLKLDTAWALETPTYEGRLAGSDDTNEDPTFLTSGVSGISVFQGRLVILSGASVTMSASGKPLRWYRSTVTELLVADPISVYSGNATTANFTHAAQFNKDLLLFSKTCQAVVPSGNAIVSPSTAQIAITSGYSSTDLAPPIVAGRSLLYYAPRSERFAGVLEMVPSNTTDSQYTTNDVTAHIPKYMPGTIRQATASTTSNSLVLVSDGDPRTMYVYQYLWGDDTKIQSAWHSWTTPYDIVCTWFVRDTVYVGMHVNGELLVASMEIQAGNTVDGLRRPFSDVFRPITVSGGTFSIPAVLRPAILQGSKLMLTYSTGSLAGEAVGFSVNEDTWVGTVVRNVPDGTYMLGLRFRSTFTPTPPLMRDQNGVVIGTGTVTLIRYECSMKNSGEFEVIVQRNDIITSEGAYSGLLYSSEDLSPDQPLYAEDSRVIIPVRLNANVASVTFFTEDEHDLGVLTLEHVMQYHPRRRRA